MARKSVVIGVVAVIAIVLAAFGAMQLMGSGGKEEVKITVTVSRIVKDPTVVVNGNPVDTYAFTIKVNNIGKTEVVIMPNSFIIGGKGVESFVGAYSLTLDGNPIGYSGVPLKAGKSATARLNIQQEQLSDSAGSEISVKVRTKAGNEFETKVKLPA